MCMPVHLNTTLHVFVINKLWRGSKLVACEYPPSLGLSVFIIHRCKCFLLGVRNGQHTSLSCSTSFAAIYFCVCGVIVAKESLQLLLTLCCIDPNNISSPHTVYKLSMIYFLLYPFIYWQNVQYVKIKYMAVSITRSGTEPNN